MLNAPALKKRLVQAMKDRPDVKQVRIAEACKVTPQAVSAWVRTGQVDPAHFPTLSQLFGKPLEFWYGTAAATVTALPSQPAGRGDLTVDIAGDAADEVAEFLGIDRSSRQYLALFQKIHHRVAEALESYVPANRLDFVAKPATRLPEETSNVERGSEEEAGQGTGVGHQGTAARKPGTRSKRKP